MLEYAYLAGTNKLVHVTEVETGINCACICPHCEDKLTAKNRVFEGRRKDFYFSHQNFKESRSCLMTQLHLAAQDYFLKLDTFILPHYTFLYRNELLTQPPRKIRIETATKEYGIDKFFADVMLVTDIGNIYIEIAVTHKNTAEKNVFYKNNKLISLEYDLGSLITLPIKEALQEMISNSALVSWVFGWDEERLIQDEERRHAETAKVKAKKAEEIAKKKQEEKDKAAEQKKYALENEPHRTLESAKSDASKRKREKYLTTPSYYEEVTYSVDGKSLTEYVELISEKKVTFDHVEVFNMGKPDYMILKAIKNYRVIYLVYVYEFNYVPEMVQKLQDAVLIRNPASIEHNKKQCCWKWLQNLKIDHERQRVKQELIDSYHFKKKFNITLNELEDDIEILANQYTFSDLNSTKKYFLWRSELINKGLFIPNEIKKNPSHPFIFKINKYHPYLWVFQEWYFLVLTKLVEIVDGITLFTPIDYDYIFEELAKFFPLHPRYLEYLNDSCFGRIKSEYVDKVHIIKSCLKIFEPQYIRSRNGGFDRIDKLSLALKV